MIPAVYTGAWGTRPSDLDLGALKGLGMIPTLDTSNYAAPYDLHAFDWGMISGGWEQMQARGLAGGVHAGNVLGLGAEEVPTTGPVTCDFTAGALVVQVQEALGVPATGVFDQATCAAWTDMYGSPPTAAALQETLGVPCDTLLMPPCGNPKRLSTGAVLGLGFFALAAGLILYGKMAR